MENKNKDTLTSIFDEKIKAKIKVLESSLAQSNQVLSNDLYGSVYKYMETEEISNSLQVGKVTPSFDLFQQNLTDGQLNEKGFILSLVASQPVLITDLPDRFKYDLDVISVAVEKNGSLLSSLGPQYLSNTNLVLKAINSDPNIFSLTDDSIKNNKLIVSLVGMKNPKLLDLMGKSLREDKEFINTMVYMNPNILTNVSENLKSDPLFVANMVKKGFGYDFASNSLKSKIDPNKPLDYLENNEVISKFYKNHPEKEVNTIGYPPPISVPIISPHWRTILSKISLINALNSNYGLPPLHPMFLSYLVAAFHAEEEYYEKLVELNKKPEAPNDTVLQKFVEKYEKEKPIDSNLWLVFILSVIAEVNPELAPQLKAFFNIYEMDNFSSTYQFTLASIEDDYKNRFNSYLTTSEINRNTLSRNWSNSFTEVKYKKNGCNIYLEDILKKLSLDYENPMELVLAIKTKANLSSLTDAESSVLSKQISTILSSFPDKFTSEEIDNISNLKVNLDTKLKSRIKDVAYEYLTTKDMSDLSKLNIEDQVKYAKEIKLDPVAKKALSNRFVAVGVVAAYPNYLSSCSEGNRKSTDVLLSIKSNLSAVIEVDKRIQGNPLLMDKSVCFDLVKNDPNVIKTIASDCGLYPQILNKALMFNPALIFGVSNYLTQECLTDPTFLDIVSGSPLLQNFMKDYIDSNGKQINSQPTLSDVEYLLSLDSTDPKFIESLSSITDNAVLKSLIQHRPSIFTLPGFIDKFKDNRELVLTYINACDSVDLKKNEALIRGLIINNKEDREIMYSALRLYSTTSKMLTSEHIDPKLFEDIDFVNKAIQSSGLFLFSLPESYPLTREQLLEAVKKNGNAIHAKCVDVKFREDPEIYEAAIKSNGNSIRKLSTTIKSDKRLGLLAVKSNPKSYVHLEGEAREDIQVIEAALAGDGNMYRSIPDRFRRNNDLIVVALKSNGNVFSELPLDLQNKPEYIRLALESNFNSISKIKNKEELKKILSKDFVLSILSKKNDSKLDFSKSIPSDFQSDIDVITLALRNGYVQYEKLSDEQKSNIDILKVAIKENRESFSDTKIDFSKNISGLKELLEVDPILFRTLPENLQSIPEIYEKACALNSDNFAIIPKNILLDRGFILKHIVNTPSLLDKIRTVDPEYYKDLVSDPDFALSCVKANPYSIQYLRTPSDANFSKIILYTALESAKEKGISIDPDEEFLARIKPFLSPMISKLLVNKAPIETLLKYIEIEKRLPEADARIAYRLLKSPLKKGYTELLSLVNPKLLENEEFALSLVDLCGKSYYDLPEKFKIDNKFVQLAIAKDGMVYESAVSHNPSCSKDVELLLSAVKSFPGAVKFADPDLLSDPNVKRELIMANIETLKDIPLEFPKDKELIMELVSLKPYSYSFLNPPLTTDKELAKKALLSDPTNMENFLLSNKPEENIALILEVMKKYPSVYYRLDKDTKNLPDISIEHSSYVFKEINKGSRRVRNTNISNTDKNIYIQHLKNNPSSIGSVPIDLLKNKAFIHQILKEDTEIYNHLSSECKSDKNLFLKVLQYNPDMINHCPNELSYLLEVSDPISYLKDSIIIDHDYTVYDEDSKKDFVLSTVVNHPEILKNISFKYPDDVNFALEVVQKNGNCLKYLPEDFKSDKDIVLESVSSAGLSIQYANHKLISDRECILTAIKYNGAAIKYADDSYKLNKDIAIKAVMQNPLSIRYIPEQVQNSDLLDLAYSLNSDVIKYFPESALNNEKVLSAILNNPNIINDLPDSYKNNYDLIKVALENDPNIVFSLDKSFVLENKQLLEVSLEAAKSKNIFNSEFVINLNSIKPYFIPPQELPKVEYVNENSDDLKLKDKVAPSTIETPEVSIKVSLSSDSLKDSYTLTEKLKINPELFFELDYNLRSDPKVVKLALDAFEGTPEAKKIYENKIENSLVEPYITIEESAREKITRKYKKHVS